MGSSFLVPDGLLLGTVDLEVVLVGVALTTPLGGTEVIEVLEGDNEDLVGIEVLLTLFDVGGSVGDTVD